MSYAQAVREFMHLYEEAGGSLTTDPVAAVRELFSAYEQARVFASELNETFAAERERTAELEQVLEDLKETHAAVEESEQRFRALVSNASDVVLVIDAENRVTYASPSAERVCGCDAEALTGAALTDHVHPGDAVKLSIALQAAREEPGRSLNVSFRVPDESGGVRYIEAALSDLGDDQTMRGIVLNGRDVSEREALAEDLRHAAYRDPLTGLPNRALFNGHLEGVWPRAGDDSSSLALLMIDIDRFKLINDTRGHAAGDAVLIEVTAQLLKLAPPGAFLARLGGDEFAFLLRTTDPAEPEQVAARLVEAFSHPDDPLPSISLGVAVPGPGRETPSDLVRAADLALYQAKREGRGRYACFDPEEDEHWVERLELEADLRTCVSRGELRALYQPIVDMTSHQVVAAEALLRWDHPTRGEVSPTVFVPLAEESGVIAELGDWILREAIGQVAVWDRDLHPSRPRIEYISVNVSAAELRDPDYAERVAEALKVAGLPPHRLQLELTETLLAEDGQEVIKRLEDLKRLGIRLAIDDFGTGYSSLSYLSRMPVDVMKVDRSFVQGMLESGRVESVVRATISLAHALDLKVVAEGVETVEQQQKLLGFGDALGQGFLYARPVSPDEVGRLLADGAQSVEPTEVDAA